MSDSATAGALLVKLLLYALITYTALVLIVFVFQRKLLYLPDKTPLPEAQAMHRGLQHWPSLEDFRGFTSLANPSSFRGTVVIFHGNAGTAYHRDFYIEALAPLGLRVILAEYPGYGGRPGDPDEEVLVEDALKTLQIAHQLFGEPLYVWGESLGCGVVTGVIANSTASPAANADVHTDADAGRRINLPLAGVVLLLPWDTLAQLAQAHYWYLPARWLIRDKFNNIDNLRDYRGKVAVVLAAEDEVVPLRHGKALYEAIDTSKQLWVFDDATHNNLPIEPHLPWWGEVIDFTSQ